MLHMSRKSGARSLAVGCHATMDTQKEGPRVSRQLRPTRLPSEAGLRHKSLAQGVLKHSVNCEDLSFSGVRGSGIEGHRRDIWV